MNAKLPKSPERADEQRGLVCPKCGCCHFRVIYTRAGWGGRIVRRRECRHCGRRVTTYERVAGTSQMGNVGWG
jgi:hypothetical protein